MLTDFEYYVLPAIKIVVLLTAGIIIYMLISPHECEKEFRLPTQAEYFACKDHQSYWHTNTCKSPAMRCVIPKNQP